MRSQPRSHLGRCANGFLVSKGIARRTSASSKGLLHTGTILSRIRDQPWLITSSPFGKGCSRYCSTWRTCSGVTWPLNVKTKLPLLWKPHHPDLGIAGWFGSAARIALMAALAIPSAGLVLKARSSAVMRLPPCLTTVTSERVGEAERGFTPLWRDQVTDVFGQASGGVTGVAVALA